MQCAAPVTGSSSMPWAGAKKRDTKSYSRVVARRSHEKRVGLVAQRDEVGVQRAHTFGVADDEEPVTVGVMRGELELVGA